VAQCIQMKYQRARKLKTRVDRRQGSVLILAIGLAFIVILLILFSFRLAEFLLKYTNNQTLTEATALRVAMILNENDNAGKMNNLVVQSRELLFDSRAAYHATLDANHFFLEPLARQLLDQSRRGAWSVDQCRQKLIAAQLNKIQTLAMTDAELATRNAKVVSVDVGHMKDLRSNVYDDSADELQEYDARKSWVDAKTQRFNGNINAKLRDEDEEQNFKISPLRIPVNNKVEQASLARVQDFISTATIVSKGEPTKVFCDQMPCAISIRITYPVDQFHNFNEPNVAIPATAITTGAQPMP
jgi:hypothetical protein